MVKPIGTKDTITKDYMADNRVFADVFNHMLYKGKNVIDPDTLHPLDTTALAVPYGSGISEVPVQKFRDTLGRGSTADPFGNPDWLLPDGCFIYP